MPIVYYEPIYTLMVTLYVVAFLIALPLLLLTDLEPMLGCFTLAGAFVLGVARRPFWTVAGLAIAATLLNVARSLSQWLVLPDAGEGLSVAGVLIGLFGIVCTAGWHSGRAVARLVLRGASAWSRED